MKHLHLFGLSVCGMLALASCTREFDKPAEQTPERTVFRMEVYTEGDTKTAVSDDGEGGFAVSWQAGDQLAVYEVGNGVVQPRAVSAKLVSGGSTQSFSFSLEGTPSSPYDYSFVYPATALGPGESAGEYVVTLPSAQVFAAGSFDPEADVLISRHITSDVRPSSLTTQFARLGATVKMTINAPTTDEQVMWVSLESHEGYLAGSYMLNPASGYLDDEPYVGSDILHLYPASTTNYTGSFDVWFRSAAITLSQEFTVTVQTNAKRYVKKVNLGGATLPFVNGKLTTFTMNMSAVAGIASKVDVFTPENTNNTNSYVEWSKTSGMPSGAQYYGYTCKANSAIQMKSGMQNSKHTGIVSTSSGGYVKNVTVFAKSTNDSDAHRIDIYGKVGDYANADALWGTKEEKGVKMGSVYQYKDRICIGSVDFTSNFTGVGIRSYDGAVQLAKIYIVWSDNPMSTATVTTGGTTNITPSAATLSATYTGATGTVYEAGFYWDTTYADLEDVLHPEQQVVAPDTESPFSATLGSLEESTTYYYRAYILEWDGSTGSYVEKLGGIASFTTNAKASYSPGGWLEMPSFTESSISSTTTSSLGDLYPLTHKAFMGGIMQRNYSALYDPEMYASYWVAYPLCDDHLTTGRNDSWAFDPDVPESKQTNCTKGAYQVTLPSGDYYARGHQIPNADRNNVAPMQEQTYYMTNITPQLQNGFNAGIWANLEEAVRGVVKNTSDTVYVVTGAAFRKVGGSEDIQTLRNGRDNKVLPIPNYYWKVLLKVRWIGEGDSKEVNGASAIGFWLPHFQDYPNGGTNYMAGVTTVDQIEAWTGFDFFTNLPSSMQDAVEDDADWDAFKAY